jgi:sarcosine oxidase subunit delta
MILLPCAWCGPRDATEFQHVGEAVSRPDPRTATPAQWRAYLYLRANPRGWTVETWYHRMGCRRFLKIERHTETNEFRPLAAAGPAGPAGVLAAAGAAGPAGVAGAAGPGGAAGPAGAAG